MKHKALFLIVALILVFAASLLTNQNGAKAVSSDGNFVVNGYKTGSLNGVNTLVTGAVQVYIGNTLVAYCTADQSLQIVIQTIYDAAVKAHQVAVVTIEYDNQITNAPEWTLCKNEQEIPFVRLTRIQRIGYSAMIIPDP